MYVNVRSKCYVYLNKHNVFVGGLKSHWIFPLRYQNFGCKTDIQVHKYKIA